MNRNKQKILDLNDQMSRVRRRIAVFEDRIKASKSVLKKHGIKTKEDAERVLKKMQETNSAIQKEIDSLTRRTTKAICDAEDMIDEDE